MIFFLIALRDLVDLLLSDSGVVTDDNGGINIALPRPVITAAEGADHIKMPDRSDFIKDACIMENWFHREFGYPMFDKLQVTGCGESIQMPVDLPAEGLFEDIFQLF